jgi:hypothetical protein
MYLYAIESGVEGGYLKLNRLPFGCPLHHHNTNLTTTSATPKHTNTAILSINTITTATMVGLRRRAHELKGKVIVKYLVAKQNMKNAWNKYVLGEDLPDWVWNDESE